MLNKTLTRFSLGVISIALGVVLLSSVCYAIPNTINYQGYLTDSVGNPLDGTVDMVFALYDVDTGGSPLWTEPQTGVVVTDGLFSVNLGEVTPITLPFNHPYWLGMKVGGDDEMTPRQPFTSVGYAYRAGIADAVTAGGVDSSMLALDAVTADKIDDGAVLTAHLDTGAVTTDKLDDDAVNSAKIEDNTVTTDDIVDGSTSGLDADLLDGYDAGDFMLSGADNWVDETGDTMSGTLNVPENGLTAGTDQLVLSSSNVGIGTPSPGEKLEVQGNVKVSGGGNGIIFPDDSKQTTAASGTEVLIPISSLPYTITQSGSYYITGDLTSTGDGITVEADNVTIDLMGYSLVGDHAGMDDDGVFMNGRFNVEVRNGTVTNFSYGIRGWTSSDRNHRVIEVRAVGHVFDGIDLSGYGHLVKDCSTSDNNFNGIHAGSSSMVTGNTSYNNDLNGIVAGEGSTVIGNTANNNESRGISAQDGSTVTGNIAYNNGTRGIYANDGSTVTGNTAYNNAYDGIYVGGASTVTGNTACHNGYNGIYVGTGSTVTGNTAYYNMTSGITTGDNCLIDGNTAYNNNQSGSSFKNISDCGTCTWGLNHNPAIP